MSKPRVDTNPAKDEISAAPLAQTVSRPTDAEPGNTTDRPRNISERRKDPANCCRCGNPNNNGKRTCESCLEEQRQNNLARKTKPVAAVCGRYLDVQGAAAYLGRTANAIYELVARQMVPHRRHGKRLVFDREELDVYMHELEGTSVEDAVARTLNNGTLKAA